MKTIHLMALDHVEHLVQPDSFYEINMDSPAITVLTDFKQTKPLIIDADTSATQADYLMKKSHLRLLLVVDERDEMIGTISLQELDGQRMQILQNQGIDRQDVSVRDLMTSRTQQMAIRYRDIQDASIEDVLHALQEKGKMHCLVVDTQAHQIRGIISASDIARRLHIPIEIEMPNTFIDIFRAVNGLDQPLSTTAHINMASV